VATIPLLYLLLNRRIQRQEEREKEEEKENTNCVFNFIMTHFNFNQKRLEVKAEKGERGGK
jgi:hypothetical protein